MLKLYIDMDGVLTDFIKQLSITLNKPLGTKFEFGNDSEIWGKIKEAGEDFWANMPWMPDGKELWDAVKKYNPTILTAPSKDNSSIEGKKKWLKRELPGAHYIIEEDKAKYADKDSILIDDREKFIKSWENSGGVTILHKNAKDTIKKLEAIMKNNSQKEDSKEKLATSIDLLKKMGKHTEASVLNKVADKWEEFLRSERGESPSQIIPEAAPMKKFIWDSSDKRLKIVKDVLDNILRRRKGLEIPREKLTEIEEILRGLNKASITEFRSQEEINSTKKDILNKAFEVNPKIAELIGLIFVPIKSKMDRITLENDVSRLAKPYLMAERKDPMLSDFGSSRTFHEMSRRAKEMDLSSLSDEHAIMVNACLDKIHRLCNEANKD